MAIVNKETDKLAKIVWDYLRLDNKVHKADAILVLGSHDIRVAEYTLEVYRNNPCKTIIVSGGFGKLTKNIWDETEAKKFRDIMVDKGIPSDSIIIEEKSTNTGENILYAKKLISNHGLKINSLIVITKPYFERRVYAVIKKLWPKISLQITSPQLTFEQYFEIYPKFGLSRNDMISLMVGDLQRIKEYSKLGFQIPQEIPDKVWDAYKKLVKLGFTEHLIKVK